MTEQTDALEFEYGKNCLDMNTLSQRNSDIITELAKIFHNISIGDIVIHKGNPYKLKRIELNAWTEYDRTHKPWVDGYAMKKNGEWGTQSHCLYSEWEKK